MLVSFVILASIGIVLLPILLLTAPPERTQAVQLATPEEIPVARNAGTSHGTAQFDSAAALSVDQQGL
jgi:hypothetical protein